MDQTAAGTLNWSRTLAAVCCVAAVWPAVAGAAPPGRVVAPSGAAVDMEPAPSGPLFPSPGVRAAAASVKVVNVVDPSAPQIYRLPPVVSPDIEEPTPKGQPSAEFVSVVPKAPEPVEADPDLLESEEPVVEDPIPERSLLREVHVITHSPPSVEPKTGQTHATDDHPHGTDVAAGAVLGSRPAADVLPYTPTTVELTVQLLPAVQHACWLAQRGAVYAAHTEFVQLLRRIAQAKDAERGTDEHARALAAGLRALDEADDFMPEGRQLEAELDLRVIASSHRTPVLAGRTDVRPDQAAALYLSFAQRQLAQAVAGQQTGSMVLHGMGKLASQLAERDGGDVAQVRKAMTMYLAALEACPQNHLAANELGVLLARNGHYAEAEALFQQAVQINPGSTAYHNLAVVQRKLYRPEQAVANEQQAARLAAWERATGAVSRRKGVQWVPPGELARAGQTPARTNAPSPAAAPPPTWSAQRSATTSLSGAPPQFTGPSPAAAGVARPDPALAPRQLRWP